MFDLKDLYQEVIVDHNRSPRNFGKLENPDRTLEGFNPLCGDRLTLYVNMNDKTIDEISFDGSGCAISVASASLMTDAVKGKTTEEAEDIFNNFHQLVTSDAGGQDLEKLGKLAALAGVREYPTRVKCATLCWHTLHSVLEGV
jgi:nitrogen fixation protein NifU and related proteins